MYHYYNYFQILANLLLLLHWPQRCKYGIQTISYVTDITCTIYDKVTFYR